MDELIHYERTAGSFSVIFNILMPKENKKLSFMLGNKNLLAGGRPLKIQSWIKAHVTYKVFSDAGVSCYPTCADPYGDTQAATLSQSSDSRLNVCQVETFPSPLFWLQETVLYRALLEHNFVF